MEVVLDVSRATKRGSGHVRWSTEVGSSVMVDLADRYTSNYTRTSGPPVVLS